MSLANVLTIIGFFFWALIFAVIIIIGIYLYFINRNQKQHQALKCHSNGCPVGVATTDPDLQKALVIDEKKYRTANYVISMREGLFRIAAAAGLDSPTHFKAEHVVYKDEKGKVWSLEEIYQSIVSNG